jgi:hypothetical protein
VTEPFTTPRPAPAQRPPSRREVLWNELESLHAQLQLPPPTKGLRRNNLYKSALDTVGVIV